MAQSVNKPVIFHYDDVKIYLKDWFEWKKSTDADYSYRAFSSAMGYSSPNQLLLVLQGKRGITDAALSDYTRVLELRQRESDYFATLVHFNQAESMTEKRGILSGLVGIKSRGQRLLDDSQYEYLMKWYHVAIREMVLLKDFCADGAWISKRLGYLISPSQAEHALQTLVDLKLLLRDDEGRLSQTSHYVSTGGEVGNVAAFTFHEQTMDLARHALNSLDHEARNVTALTFTLRREDYAQMVSRLTEARQAIIRDLQARAVQDQDEDLYQLNIHFFPVTVRGKHAE